MTAPVVPENITVLVECRQEARRNKEFEKADSIRAELFSHGWTVEDDNDISTCTPLSTTPLPLPKVEKRLSDSVRRKSARRKNVRNRLKKARFALFADFVIDTFGLTRIQTGGIIDVAGGKARLALEFTVRRKVPCTVVDPRSVRLSAFTTRSLVTMAYEWEEKKHEDIPYVNAIDVSEVLDEGECVRMGNERLERTRGFLHHTGFSFHRCLFDENYMHNNTIWEKASIVIGMHPDEATEAIVDCALAGNKPFAIVPCCVFTTLFPDRKLSNGKSVRTLDDFYTYLCAKDPSILRTTLPDLPGCNVVLYKL